MLISGLVPAIVTALIGMRLARLADIRLRTVVGLLRAA
jgi:hypothetical protein